MMDNILREEMIFKSQIELCSFLKIHHNGNINKKQKREVSKFCDYETFESTHKRKILITRVKIQVRKKYNIVNYKFSIGDNLVDGKRNLTIIDMKFIEKEAKSNHGSHKFIKKEKLYKFRCNKCGCVNWTVETQLIDGKCGCPVCCSNSKIIVKGINDISITAPWMMKYFVNMDDAYNNARYSKKKVNMVCPDCRRI